VSTAARFNFRRAALTAAALAALSAATVVFAQPATAAASESCGKKVFADWYDNGRVDNIYPQRCYREAIRLLPVDIRDYSSAREDILRALLYAQQGKPDPGDGGTGGGGSDPGGNGGSGGSGGGGGNGGTNGGGTGEGRGDGGSGTVDPGDVDTSGPSSVPVPLIVLAAIAATLLALGAAGYVTRRAAGRPGGPPAL
jgi:hypothetical protein